MGCSQVVGSGVRIEQQRAVAPFDQLVVSGTMNMDVEIGDYYRVILSGDDNVVSAVETRIADGVLRVRAPKAKLQKQQLYVTVVTPYLNFNYFDDG